jgi:hypothetical protein
MQWVASVSSKTQQAVKLLEDGIPRFPFQIRQELGIRGNQLNAGEMYFRGKLGRSTQKHPVRPPRKREVLSYAYVHPKFAGKRFSWRHEDREYTDIFHVREGVKCKDSPYGSVQRLIWRAFKEVDGMALFSREVTKIASKLEPNVTHSRIKNALSRMYPRHITRLDNVKGWKFHKGYLWAPKREGILKRLAKWDDEKLSVYSSLEISFLRFCENAVVTSKEIRDAVGVQEKMLGWYARKLGRESRYRVIKKGSSSNYRVELQEDKEKKLDGYGLIPWLRFAREVD